MATVSSDSVSEDSKEWLATHEGTLLRNLASVSVRSVTVGGAHVIFVTEIGGAFACGRNSRGQLGVGDLLDRREPCPMLDLCRDYYESPTHQRLFGQVRTSTHTVGAAHEMTMHPGCAWRITAAACGSEHTLLLAEKTINTSQRGQVFACGAYEALGIEACSSDQQRPQALQGLSHVTAIAAREGASCCAAPVLDEDGRPSDEPQHLLYFWGELNCCACPDFYPEPVPLYRVPAAVEAVALGLFFGLALDANGEVYAWGDGTYGELGGADEVDIGGGLHARIEEIPVPGKVKMPRIPVHPLQEPDHDIAGPARPEGNPEPRVFGRRRANSPERQATTEEEPPTAARVVDIACGERHSILLDDSGRVFAFGENISGQCGVPETVGAGHINGSLIPKPGLVAVQCPRHSGTLHTGASRPYEIGAQIFAGTKHSAVVTRDRRLYVWGHPANRRLGDAGLNVDGSEAGEAASKERPPGVAVRSALRDAVRRPRLVFSQLHRRVTTVGLGDACTIIVTGDGILPSSVMESSCGDTVDEASPLRVDEEVGIELPQLSV